MLSEEQGPAKGKIKLKITCPLYQVVEREVDRILLPTYHGMFEVLPRRAPLFIQIKAGVLTARAGDEKEDFLVSAGLCEIRRDICSVAAWAGRASQINRERVQQQLLEAETFLKKENMAVMRHELLARVDFLKMILEVIN